MRSLNVEEGGRRVGVGMSDLRMTPEDIAGLDDIRSHSQKM